MSRRRNEAGVQEGPAGTGEAQRGPGDLTQRHLRIGWWSLLVFLSLGIVLEALHGLKADYYLNLAHETRRLMWRLAHAHGALLALVHLAFAATMALGSQRSAGAGWTRFASLGFTGATVLLPGGFFLGGVVLHGGDPGRGILLVPFGALLFFGAVLLVALGTTRRA